METPLASDPTPATSDSLQLEAYGLYCALSARRDECATTRKRSQVSVASFCTRANWMPDGRAMVIAGNVSGCAILAATADLAVQKLVIRDGVVDFVITSLDEALRILKNEVRKCATVAVCVAAAPSVVEREMDERGVVPDLVFEALPDEPRDVPDFGSGACRSSSNCAG